MNSLTPTIGVGKPLWLWCTKLCAENTDHLCIYIEYSRLLSDESQLRASGSLSLTQLGEREYQISSIDVDEEDKGLASELLRRTFEQVDESGITITYDLFLKTRNLEKSRHLLQKYGFEKFEEDSECELWVRKPQR